MPLFHFHLRSGNALFEDRRGGAFADLRAASDWAAHDVRMLILDGVVDATLADVWIEITDEHGVLLTTLTPDQARHLQ